MFKVSKAAEQALRLTMRLAVSGRQHTLGQLAEAETLPSPTVAKLLNQLRRRRVVAAVRGRNGGYVLATVPERISAAQVLQAVGCAPAVSPGCQSESGGEEPCPRAADCGLRAVWNLLQTRLTGLLEKISLADLIRAEAEVQDRVDWVWSRSTRPVSPSDTGRANCWPANPGS